MASETFDNMTFIDKERACVAEHPLIEKKSVV